MKHPMISYLMTLFCKMENDGRTVTDIFGLKLTFISIEMM